ncbi:phage protein Gp27 family protein [Filifactor villosus]|uniref:Phage protein Gp27 family protein n=1 Tax=Filifactor villosus TaxID=29374 RepID=A0ABV9QM27_9FIRM
MNRAHSKIDKLPDALREAIHDAIVNKRMTYEQITKMIHEAGHKDISSKSVARYGKKFSEKLESITRAKEQAKAIIESSAGSKLDMAEASSTMAFQLLMNMLLNTEDGKVDKNAIAGMQALASLERSAVSREKLRYQFNKGVDAAAEKIKLELQEVLKTEPELLGKILEILERVEKQAKEENLKS